MQLNISEIIMITKVFYTLLLLLLSFHLSSATEPLFFPETPSLSPDGKTIYFSFQGDLWKVPHTGGQALRITALDGNESNPVPSPDGQWLAFSSNQSGNYDIYVMPAAGGPIRQLSFHEADDEVSSWSWDSQSIFFSSSRYNRFSTFQIALQGGTPQRLFPHYFNTVHNLMPHPNGAFYFNESWESSANEPRQGYEGAYAPQIKSYHPNSDEFRQWTTSPGKDFRPMIDQTGNVFFLSDSNNKRYNLFTLENNKPKALTSFNTPVRQPALSATGNHIVYIRDYQLYLFDTKTDSSYLVPIQINNFNSLTREQNFELSGQISHFDVSGDGKKIALVSRGELFVSDVAGKYIRKIPTQANGRVEEAYWLADHQRILFSQTVQGYQNWFILDAETPNERPLLQEAANQRALAFNSDKSQAVYLSGRNELRLLNLKTLKSETLLQEEFWGFYNDVPQFSPDDQFILFTAYRNFERDVFAFHLENKQLLNLTQTGVSEVNPVWSPNGKHLFFLSNPSATSYPYGLRDARIFRLALQHYDQPFRSEKWEQLFQEPDTSKQKISVSIDTDQLMERAEQIGPNFGHQSALWVHSEKSKTFLFFNSNHDGGKTAAWMLTHEPFEETKTEKISGIEGLQQVIAINKKVYARSGGNIYELKIDGKKAEKIELKHQFSRNLHAEFIQMFDEVWANVEENFYNDSLHNTDWTGLRQHYAAFLPHLNSRADLRRLLNDLLGELNASHLRFRSTGKEEKTFYQTKTQGTGILFDQEQPYTVSSVLHGSPAAMFGKDIRPGDQLVEVNRIAVNPSQNREAYFIQPSINEELELGFLRNNEIRRVRIHPSSYTTIRSLHYDDWMQSNQNRVDSLSQRRIAYIHMKNMGQSELDRFLKEMISEAESREGLILDLRYNTGGNVHNDVLQFLSQRPYLQWQYRGGMLSSQPHFAPAAKPIVLLINEQSLSDAEMTAAGFKTLGLGTVMGVETYRWIIFTSGKSLVDGSFYRLPAWGCYTLDGQNLEKTGVAPDLEIPMNFLHRIRNQDPQIEAAVQHILRNLNE